MHTRFASLLLMCVLMYACQPAGDSSDGSDTAPTMPAQAGFQTTLEDGETDLYYLSHPAGIHAAITNYGGRLVSLWVKDQQGTWTDVVLGFDSVAQYQRNGVYGATVGRYANRIAKGQFSIGGKSYQLPLNNGPQYLAWRARRPAKCRMGGYAA